MPESACQSVSPWLVRSPASCCDRPRSRIAPAHARCLLSQRRCSVFELLERAASACTAAALAHAGGGRCMFLCAGLAESHQVAEQQLASLRFGDLSLTLAVARPSSGVDERPARSAWQVLPDYPKQTVPWHCELLSPLCCCLSKRRQAFQWLQAPSCSGFSRSVC